MRITQQQFQRIEQLTCERLSSNSANLRLVDGFYNTRNTSISENLLNDAYAEDEVGKIAYYVVKDENNRIIFYFSLKCGILYDKFIDERTLKLLNSLMTYLTDISKQDTLSDNERNLVLSFQEKLRSHKGLTKQEIASIPNNGESIISKLEKEIGENVTHVGSTFSGIELVHFCANDDTRDYWDESKEGQKLGVVIFWYFVVSKVLEAMKHVGCQYLFLFAADKSEDEELVAYYRDNLYFKEAKDMATIKPIYDLTCKFMYQETCNLIQEREHFYNNYNIDSNEV